MTRSHSVRSAGVLALLLLSSVALTGCKKDKEKSEQAKPASSSATFEVRSSSQGPGTIAITPRRTRYASGASVTFTATPRAGTEFLGWGGDLQGSDRTITIKVRGDLQVTARFDYPEPERSTRSAVEALLVASSHADTSAQTLEDRIGAVANGFGDLRDGLYGKVASADEGFLSQLTGCGEESFSLANMEELVLQEVGPWAFLPGRTVSIRMLYETDPGLPGCSAAEFQRQQALWLSRVKQQVEALDSPDRLSSTLLDPRLSSSSGAPRISDSWRLTQNRRQAFEQERRVYLAAAKLADDPGLKARLEEEALAVEELRDIDDELLAVILQGVSPDQLEGASASAGPPLSSAESAGAAGAIDGALGR